MARRKYIWRDGMFIEVEATSSPAAQIHVQDDTMDALENHVDGKIYDSKSAFRRATKEGGCVELGNDKLPPKTQVKIGGMREDIERATEAVKRGEIPTRVREQMERREYEARKIRG